VRWNAETRQHEKKMLPGMKAKGAVFRLGPATAPTTVLCEGYCTGLSIKLALEQMRMPWSVLVCLSDSNMVYVAPHVTGRAIVFADNDKSGAGEREAIATGLPYCMAPDVGMDANDLQVRDGLFAVCAVMRNLRESVAA
jgi:putative DNA primase/helicase